VAGHAQGAGRGRGGARRFRWKIEMIFGKVSHNLASTGVVALSRLG
jgi:hypothetical protein